MARTIIDILTGSSFTTAESSGFHEREATSIRNHLQKLLNSRRGSLTHRPDFGMPDIAEIYLGLPYTSDTIIVALLYAIEQFEPRLQNVQVREYDLKPGQSMTHYEVTGTTLKKDSIRLIVSLCRNGRIEVRTSEEYLSYV